MKHVLTPSQAKRLDMPELAWQVVEVEMKEPGQKSKHTQHLPMARLVVHNGRVLAGSLELTCKTWEERQEWQRRMALLEEDNDEAD